MIKVSKPIFFAIVNAWAICGSGTLSLAADLQSVERGVRLRQQATNITYNVELVRGTQRAIVPTTYEFKSGDRFALRVKVGSPAYVYVLNRTFNGPPDQLRSNRQIRLIPEAGSGSASDSKPVVGTPSDQASGPVPKGTPYVLVYPAKGNRLLNPGIINIIPAPGQLMEMDETPGIEKLLVIVSPHPIDLTRYFDANTGKLRTRPSAAPGSAPALPKDSAEDVLAKLNQDLTEMAANSEFEEADVPSRAIIFRPNSSANQSTGTPKPEAPILIPDAPHKKTGGAAKTEAAKTESARKSPAKNSGPGVIETSGVSAPKKPAQPFLVEITLAHHPA